MLCLWPDGDCSSWRVCSRAFCRARTDLTLAVAKLDLDYLVLDTVRCWCPTATDLTVRTDGSFLLPIDHKVLCREPCSFFSLPMVVTARRADQTETIFLCTLNKQL